MNVNIVCRDPNEDKILPRLAHALARGTGWRVSPDPDSKADLNYFMVYIDYAERCTDWHYTPVAAYFSHYEVDHPYKKLWWTQADAAVDIRVVTSRLAIDHLVAGKPIIKVTPPVDPQFVHLQRKKNELPVIGFSGYIDGRSMRKGQDLVKKLSTDLQGRYRFMASGSGWPVPTCLYRFDQLPGFYNSLDLFVCTSTIEGIPMPPLEALACGVPVVIPSGVGLLDELPTVSGIAHYPAGDYRRLREAVESMLNVFDYTQRDSLSQHVSQFNLEQWCESNVIGLEQAMQDMQHDNTVVIESDRHGGRGVLYVAYGAPARQCARGAIASFKQYMPEVPVALVSDAPLGPEDIFISHTDEDIGGRSAKTLIDVLAPKEWSYVMYLDADTEVIAPLHFLFQLVEDGFDMVICKNPGKYHTARQMVRSDNRDECEFTFRLFGTDELIQLNGGVFVFQRNARTQKFFSTWHSEWQRWGKRDQAALLRALREHPLKMHVLGNEWNTITRYDPVERSAGILHYPMTARRWRGVLHGRSDSPEAWAAVQKFNTKG